MYQYSSLDEKFMPMIPPGMYFHGDCLVCFLAVAAVVQFSCSLLFSSHNESVYIIS